MRENKNKTKCKHKYVATGKAFRCCKCGQVKVKVLEGFDYNLEQIAPHKRLGNKI